MNEPDPGSTPASAAPAEAEAPAAHSAAGGPEEAPVVSDMTTDSLMDIS